MLKKLRAVALALSLAVAGGGLALAQDGYHYYDRDDHGYGRGYSNPGLRIARSTGYDDGSRVAYHDLTHNNRFDPYPRGKYAHEDHGYHREFGDKYAYRAEYETGYRAGYAAGFRR